MSGIPDQTPRVGAPVALPTPMRRDRFGPSAELARLAAASGLPRVATPFGMVWLVTQHRDVRIVLADPRTFSTAGPTPLQRQRDVAGAEDENGLDDPGFLATYDPPEHTRLRRMLTAEFTARRMRRLEPRVEQIITTHLDAPWQAGPPADLGIWFTSSVPNPARTCSASITASVLRWPGWRCVSAYPRCCAGFPDCISRSRPRRSSSGRLVRSMVSDRCP